MHVIYLLIRKAISQRTQSRLAPSRAPCCGRGRPHSAGKTRQFHADARTHVPRAAHSNFEQIFFKMVRTKDGDGIKSNLIVSEVQKRPCLFDTNDPFYGDKTEKLRCWEEVCECVVPGWLGLTLTEKFAAGT